MPRSRRPGPPSRIPMPGTNRSRRLRDGRARAGWTRPRFPPTIILRSRIMADRVSASITIGGALLSALLPDFIALIEQQGLSTEWDGEAFTASDLTGNAALELMAHEVAWGRFEELEAFCVRNALPFSRWSGAYPGQWGRERVGFTGGGGPPSGRARGRERR